MKNILSPSILAADFKELGDAIKKTEENGAQYLHFDVMDGMFVPSISFGLPVLQSVRAGTKQVLDVHLMITEPIRYVKDFASAGADLITVHLEACEDVDATLEAIRAQNIKAGLSIKPGTKVEELVPYLDKIDMVLVMSVEPGFGGQKFITETLDKTRAVRKMANDAGLSLDIEMDGGIYRSNVKEVLKAGANVVVSGSDVFQGDIAQNTAAFMEILGSYE
ncbi:MAG: ribulose-phosphate 3-epimerase [Hespellia sp.]|jgi:ribulose-phosphate 3-epimerase|nr:ribulose-phosphate 3-epimerase [Hespellia sp.]